MDSSDTPEAPRRNSLEAWAARRKRRRESDHWITGTRRAVPLAGGGASHLHPDAPRLLLERQGDTGAWAPVGVAADHAEAVAWLNGRPEPV
ncbi:DUF6087 family protein [Streptomyces sp. NPDC060028]|uniref:DUF6087 family protein n=1 Tax=Streptomyces sp. NPDC060028 TaxID=3347041 RepID=UPI003680019F